MRMMRMMMPIPPPTICTRIWVKTVFIAALVVTICSFQSSDFHKTTNVPMIIASNALAVHSYASSAVAAASRSSVRRSASVTKRLASSVDRDDGGDSHIPMFVVFGRPGAGKTTVADAAVAKFREHSSNKNKNHSCLGLDLDVCIPQWMKDNFANGKYPTLDERITFAHDACDYVARQIEEELTVLSKNEGKQGQDTKNESSKATTLCCCVSFSFVNTDLRDVFRSRFPHSRWILVDTTDQEAEDRILQREDHFYKGKNPEDEDGSADTEEDTNEPDNRNVDNDDDNDNSEWEFAPVTFPHTRLNGRDPIETNADKILQEIISTIYA